MFEHGWATDKGDTDTYWCSDDYKSLSITATLQGQWCRKWVHGILSSDNISQLWRRVCQKRVSRGGASIYIPQYLYLWDVITCHSPWSLRRAHKSMVSCQKGPTRHANAWQIGPFRQDTLEVWHTCPHIIIKYIPWIMHACFSLRSFDRFYPHPLWALHWSNPGEYGHIDDLTTKQNTNISWVHTIDL